MNETSPLIAELNRMAAAAAGQGAGRAEEGQDFGALLQGLLRRVNEAQKESGRQQRAFELGEADADLVDVMLAMQKARVAFQATLQVRNRLVRAYQDVMSMPL